MTKPIVYDGQIPLDENFLNICRANEIAVGGALALILGEGRAVVGMGCGPTSPASMAVTVKPGGLSSFTPVDSAVYGSLPAILSQTQKLGWNTDSQNFSVNVTGLSAGQSKNYLIAGKFVEEDTDPQLIQYYNKNAPNTPYNGPNNGDGSQQPTSRKTYTALQLVEGSPGTTGSQATPSVPSGYTGLYVITVTFGDTSITSGRIAKHADFPAPPAIGGGEFGVETLTAASGNYTVPAGKTKVRVVLIAGGGGGGGAYTNGSCGGGGGGETLEIYTSVFAGQVIPYTIGAGGAGGVNTNGPSPGTEAPGNTGGNGGSTTFGTYATAVGGQGSPGAGNDIAKPGGWGGNSGTVANTVTSWRRIAGGRGDTGFIPSGIDGGRAGMGGSAYGNQGGPGGIGTYWAANGTATPGTNPGVGGGGGGSGNVGAAGANGVIYVYAS